MFDDLAGVYNRKSETLNSQDLHNSASKHELRMQLGTGCSTKMKMNFRLMRTENKQKKQTKPKALLTESKTI